MHTMTRTKEKKNSNMREMDEDLRKLIEEYGDIFRGLGRARKVPPIHIEVAPTVKPLQQKARPIPIHYKKKLKKPGRIDTGRSSHSIKLHKWEGLYT